MEGVLSRLEAVTTRLESYERGLQVRTIQSQYLCVCLQLLSSTLCFFNSIPTVYVHTIVFSAEYLRAGDRGITVGKYTSAQTSSSKASCDSFAGETGNHQH